MTDQAGSVMSKLTIHVILPPPDLHISRLEPRSISFSPIPQIRFKRLPTRVDPPSLPSDASAIAPGSYSEHSTYRVEKVRAYRSLTGDFEFAGDPLEVDLESRRKAVAALAGTGSGLASGRKRKRISDIPPTIDTTSDESQPQSRAGRPRTLRSSATLPVPSTSNTHHPHPSPSTHPITLRIPNTGQLECSLPTLVPSNPRSRYTRTSSRQPDRFDLDADSQESGNLGDESYSGAVDKESQSQSQSQNQSESQGSAAAESQILRRRLRRGYAGYDTTDGGVSRRRGGRYDRTGNDMSRSRLGLSGTTQPRATESTQYESQLDSQSRSQSQQTQTQTQAAGFYGNDSISALPHFPSIPLGRLSMLSDLFDTHAGGHIGARARGKERDMGPPGPRSVSIMVAILEVKDLQMVKTKFPVRKVGGNPAGGALGVGLEDNKTELCEIEVIQPDGYGSALGGGRGEDAATAVCKIVCWGAFARSVKDGEGGLKAGDVVLFENLALKHSNAQPEGSTISLSTTTNTTFTILYRTFPTPRYTARGPTTCMECETLLTFRRNDRVDPKLASRDRAALARTKTGNRAPGEMGPPAPLRNADVGPPICDQHAREWSIVDKRYRVDVRLRGTEVGLRRMFGLAEWAYSHHSLFGQREPRRAFGD